MAQRVRARRLWYLRPADRLLHGLLNHRIVDVMPALDFLIDCRLPGLRAEKAGDAKKMKTSIMS